MSGDSVKTGISHYVEEKKVLKEKSKIGHRRINEEGTVTYKKKTSSEIQKAIQLGIRISVTIAHQKRKRDMLLRDFGVVESLSFPRSGGKETPTHDLSDFTFSTFAPIAFRYFRDFFKVDIDEYLNSICHQDLRELSNAGASGSIFYITYDDEFIIKTVQRKEASFLQKLLPEYYINLIQHPRTLLPKYYGLYCYQTMGKNIRFVIMNNLLPSIKIHEKYDLKGSTYKRLANENEKNKSSPTLKDLDFMSNHSESLYLESDTYEALMNTIQRDCRVLESFSIMDYSLLLGIHNIDQSIRDKKIKKLETDTVNHSKEDNHAIKNGNSEQFKDQISDSVKMSKEIEIGNIQNQADNSVSTSNELYCTPEDAKGMINFPIGNDQESSSSKFQPSSENEVIDSLQINDILDNKSASESARHQENQSNVTDANVSSKPVTNVTHTQSTSTKDPFNRQKFRTRSTRRIAAYSTVLESIHAPVEQVESQGNDEDFIPTGGIPARNKLGDRLILFMGIIDILQSYRVLKKMEHNMKAIFLDPNTISVTNPTFYAQRFQDFFANTVFKKIPSLDQPQILGPHAKRFRNFVHMAMRQNPERKRSTIPKDINYKEKSINSQDTNDKLKANVTQSVFKNGDKTDPSKFDGKVAGHSSGTQNTDHEG